MKKLFTFFSLVMLFALVANAADNYRRTWDFREGWSATTLELMAGDTQHWTAQGTGFQNTASFSDFKAVVTYNGEDIAVPELEGLTLGGMKSSAHVQIASVPGTGAIWPDNAQCLWINGKKTADYISFTVPAGENVKIGYCSHKDTEARGFKVSAGFADAEGNTTFTSKGEGVVVDVELINSNAEESTLKLSSTNGHHIYYIIIGEGDAPKSAKVGYLYYDAAGDGFDNLPLYTAIKETPNYTYEPINLNTKTPTKEEMMGYDAVVLDGGIPANTDIVSALKPNLYWQPVVNFNPNLAQAFGFGEPLTSASEIVWAVDTKEDWFEGFEGWVESMFGISNGEVMPTPLKLSAAHANATSYIVSGSEEFAYPDSVIAYTYNNGHNAYVYYGLAGDYAEGTDVILKNAIADAVSSKADVSACPVPAFKAAYGEMNTTVTLSDLNKNAVIYYTTNGSDPTVESTVYTEPLSFTAETTVKAIAVADGYTVSDVNSFDVKLFHQAKTPSVYTSGDEKTENATVTLSSEEGDNVAIWYNFTGDADTLKSSKYVGAITLNRAATLTAFAIGVKEGADTLVQSDLVSADIKANMLKVRRDEVAHFNAAGWNTLTNLVLDGTAMEAWASSNYYFTWGKTAVMSYDNIGEPLTKEDGDLLLDGNGNPVYNTQDRATSVTENTADVDWKITSRGQVMVYQSNTLSSNIGNFGGYNPERAEDYVEKLGTTSCIQFASIASGDKATAAIATTKAVAAPFNVVAIVANVNGDKTTGVANPCKVAIQVSADGNTWETVGDTLITASVYRNYKKFEVAYEGKDAMFIRVASISGSSQAVHDVYVFNHGEKSAAEENAYTGIEDISSAVEANTNKAVKYLKNGRIVIIKGASEYSVAGAQMK